MRVSGEGGCPKALKKLQKEKKKKEEKKWGASAAIWERVQKWGGGRGKTRIRGVPHVGRENEGKMGGKMKRK